MKMIVKERAAEIGGDLRKLREQKQLTLDKVSEILKIRKFYLEKIEDGDLQNIPGIAYQKMYLKTYCKFLDFPLDYAHIDSPANENIESLEEYNRNVEEKSILPLKTTLFICGLLIVLLVLFY